MFKAFTKFWVGGGTKKIRLGICAMDKKTKSKPMKEILDRFPLDMFEIIIFGNEIINKEPIENWPIVEVLIAFYSNHFPMEKALAYVNLRKPFMINDLDIDDKILKDRRKVYEILESIGIHVPVHVFCEREGSSEPPVLEEFDEV